MTPESSPLENPTGKHARGCVLGGNRMRPGRRRGWRRGNQHTSKCKQTWLWNNRSVVSWRPQVCSPRLPNQWLISQDRHKCTQGIFRSLCCLGSHYTLMSQGLIWQRTAPKLLDRKKYSHEKNDLQNDDVKRRGVEEKKELEQTDRGESTGQDRTTVRYPRERTLRQRKQRVKRETVSTKASVP